MTIPPWEWEARTFDPEADLTKTIHDALAQQRAEAVIYARWPWMPERLVNDFLWQAGAAEDDERRWIIERFQHSIRAEWSNRYEPKMYRRPVNPWWRRWVKKHKGDNNR